MALAVKQKQAVTDLSSTSGFSLEIEGEMQNKVREHEPRQRESMGREELDPNREYGYEQHAGESVMGESVIGPPLLSGKRYRGGLDNLDIRAFFISEARNELYRTIDRC